MGLSIFLCIHIFLDIAVFSFIDAFTLSRSVALVACCINLVNFFFEFGSSSEQLGLSSFFFV